MMKKAFVYRFLTAFWVLAAAGSAGSATIIQNLLAPVGSIISQPDFSGPAFNGAQDFTDNAGPPGQTFSTLSGFSMASVTVKGFADTGASFGGGVNTGTWTITVSRVDPGNVLTRLSQETANPSALTNGSAYLTISLDTPVVLSAGVQYAFDVFSSSGWFGLAKSSTDIYAAGSAMQHGATSRTSADGAAFANAQGVDRTFFIGAVPEPGSALLGLMGLFSFGFRRHRSK